LTGWTRFSGFFWDGLKDGEEIHGYRSMERIFPVRIATWSSELVLTEFQNFQNLVLGGIQRSAILLLIENKGSWKNLCHL